MPVAHQVTDTDLLLLYEYRRRKQLVDEYDEETLAKARQDLAFYFKLARELEPLPHQVTVMEHVQDFLERCWATSKEKVKGRRVLNINLPPGAGKSSIITTTTPPWILGRRPYERIGVISAKGDLADLFELVAKRDIESSDLYRAVFPDEDARPDHSRAWAHRKLFIKGLPRGQISPSLSASSIFGSILGKRFSCIIIDDGQDQNTARTPAARQKTWAFVDSSVLSRAPMWCPIINVQQRLHKHDLSGMFEFHYDAETVAIPALDEGGNSYWPDEYPADALRQKQRVDPYRFALWYMQDATYDDGSQSIFARDTFRYHNGVVPQGWRVQSWDTAGKAEQHNDLSAYVDAIITSEDDVYVIDMGWMRLDPIELEEAIKHQYSRRDVNAVVEAAGERNVLPAPSLVLVEDASSGQTLAQRIAKLTALPVQPVTAKGDKVTRAKSVQGWFKANKVFFPAHHRELVMFEAFLTNFPQDTSDSDSATLADDDPFGDAVRHDDPVDALVQLIKAVINDELEPPQDELRMEWM